MEKEIKKIIISSIDNLPDGKVVIVLKGFHRFLKKIDGLFLLTKNVVYKGNRFNIQTFVNEIQQPTQKSFLLYEDLNLMRLNLFDKLLPVKNTSLIILDNDFYDEYYPSSIKPKNFEREVYFLHDSEIKLNKSLYDDIQMCDNIVYASYNKEFVADTKHKYKTMNLSDILIGSVENNENGLTIEIPDGCSDVELASITTKLIECCCKEVIVSRKAYDCDQRIRSLAKKVEKCGIKVVIRPDEQ